MDMVTTYDLLQEDPHTLSRDKLVNVMRLQKKIIAVHEDPWTNLKHTHPESHVLKRRILENDTLKVYYRPDLFNKHSTNPTPSEKQIQQAFTTCTQGLDEEVVNRTAYSVGVYCGGKRLSENLCIALFSRLTDMDVPYQGPSKEVATAWKND